MLQIVFVNESLAKIANVLSQSQGYTGFTPLYCDCDQGLGQND